MKKKETKKDNVQDYAKLEKKSSKPIPDKEKKEMKKLNKIEKTIKKDIEKQNKSEVKKFKKVEAKDVRNQKIKTRLEKYSVAEWFKLDNAATIYPSLTDENWSFVVRISALLKQEVKPEILQLAVNDAMQRFPTFNVGLKRGIFWDYFEEKNFSPIIKKEKFPCTKFKVFNGKKHIIRILYYNNRISLECFHGIADGRGMLIFFNSILRRYFVLLGEKIESLEGCLDVLDKPQKEEIEDSFFKNGTKDKKVAHHEEKAFLLKGTEEEHGVVNATMGTIDVPKLKEVAQKYNATITEYLASVMLYVIWDKHRNTKRPIKISIPIDLRRFFNSKTLRNFSGYINVKLPKKNEDYKLEEIISIVKKDFSRINKEYLTGFINSNISMQKNFFIKAIPIMLKQPIINLCYKCWGENYQTINMSNLGLVKVPPEFDKYVDKYCVNLGRPKYNPKTVGVISYKDKMVITFSSKVKELDLERDFFTYLSKTDEIPVLIESNRRDLYD